MKLRYKIGTGLLVVLTVSLSVLALVLSYDEDCPPAAGLPAGVEGMNAVTYQCYGSADVLQLGQVPKPVPADNEILVRVKAAAVNPLDWHYMRGKPYIMRLMGAGIGAPDDPRMGVDFAGLVEAVGENVKGFKPGDEVFGGRSGAFAEYVVIPEDRAIAMKPANISFEDAAASPIAATTALQALRDRGEISGGQNVLVNGASGGVGTYAVQIAKAMGATVSGVCSTRNIEMVRSIGADHVFDYKKENYLDSGERFDLIIDNVGNHGLLENRKVMTPQGRLVIVGGSDGNWLGPLMRPLASLFVSPFVEQEFPMILAQLSRADLEILAKLMETGQVKSVIDRRYPLSEIADAIRYSESGRARGKIIIQVDAS